MCDGPKLGCPTDREIMLFSLFTGIAGALISFGYYGTIQAACYGGGMGMIAPILVLLVVAVLS